MALQVRGKNPYSGLNCPFKTESVFKRVRQIFLLSTHLVTCLFFCMTWHSSSVTHTTTCLLLIHLLRQGSRRWPMDLTHFLTGKLNQVYLRHMLGDSARPAYSTEPGGGGGSRPLRELSQHSQRSHIWSHTHYPRLSHMAHLHRDSQRHVKANR